MDPETAQTLETVSGLALGVYLAAGLVLVGLVLLLAGRKLARASCVLIGLALGSTIGAAFGQFFGLSPTMLIAASLVGALGGALFAGFLFRAFVAVTGAAVLAAAVPAVVLIWQGAPPPTLEADEQVAETLQAPAGETAGAVIDEQLAEATRAKVDEIVGRIRGVLSGNGTTDADPASGDEATPVEGETADTAASNGLAQLGGRLLDELRAALNQQEEALRAWWDQLSPALRGTVITGSLIGAVVGLILGLLMPHTASSIESSMLGSVLIYLPGSRILAQFAPAAAAYLPAGPRGTLLILGLITLVGVAFQWTIFRKKADS